MTAIGGIVSGITTGAEGAVAGTVVEPGGGTVVGGIGGVTVGVVGGSVTGFVTGIAATTTADDFYD
ncbi:hypothetical protein [Latilactobacillus graminis]|uniref:Uncharacterized protein n=2 Tax=Latilactobacillus graminis TaxID=60519 RepID=A0AA89I755_9LACO|nr:hypothetical protein [Latilactobacillus graminis]KRM22322.1 hypothetical protein FC90_GL000923 [Latilactobacillus graminis DSM 20719]QFP79503.1 hypothetical protein LG542_04330 [Latilactobacillus graminis]